MFVYGEGRRVSECGLELWMACDERDYNMKKAKDMQQQRWTEGGMRDEDEMNFDC